MSEPQPRRVKHRARGKRLAAAIVHVAGHRVSESGEVDTDLMRAPGVEVTAQKGMGSFAFEDGVPSARETTARDHGHPLSLPRMASDRAFELARVGLHLAARDGDIRAAERAVAELRRESAVRGVVARDDDEARRPLVEAVDDSRPSGPARSGPAAASTEQRMNEGPGVMPGRRVHDHARRLVDDGEVVILVDDVEGYVLGSCLQHKRLRQLDFDDVTGRDAVGGLGRPAVEPNEVSFDQPRRSRPAQLVRLLGDEAVQPRRRSRGDQLSVRRNAYAAISSTTPTDTAESATLKTGQK